jgi:HAD superfamily hydrolase (TIGR01490 family)
MPSTHPSSATAAFFDVDNTIIRGASAFHLAKSAYQRKFFGTRDILRFAMIQARYLVWGENKEEIDKVRNRALSLIAGRSVAEIATLGEEVWDAVLSLRIYPGTRRLLDEHIAAGHQVWLITATPVEIAQLIARRLGATGALGTIAEHKDGFYTGRLNGDLMHGQAKAAAIVELANINEIDLDESYAYGDSLNDLPMMRAVGHPCPINPDLRLRRHAQEVGWPIREFRGRSQRTAGRGVRTASWAGAAWVLGLVLRAARRRLRGQR